MKRLLTIVTITSLVFTLMSTTLTFALQQGDLGEEVNNLQTALIDAGYLTGPADGSFGPATEAALKAWQTDNGVAATGIADENTLYLLLGVEPAPDEPDFTWNEDRTGMLKELGFYSEGTTDAEAVAAWKDMFGIAQDTEDEFATEAFDMITEGIATEKPEDFIRTDFLGISLYRNNDGAYWTDPEALTDDSMKWAGQALKAAVGCMAQSTEAPEGDYRWLLLVNETSVPDAVDREFLIRTDDAVCLDMCTLAAITAANGEPILLNDAAGTVITVNTDGTFSAEGDIEAALADYDLLTSVDGTQAQIPSFTVGSGTAYFRNVLFTWAEDGTCTAEANTITARTYDELRKAAASILWAYMHRPARTERTEVDPENLPEGVTLDDLTYEPETGTWYQETPAEPQTQPWSPTYWQTEPETTTVPEPYIPPYQQEPETKPSVPQEPETQTPSRQEPETQPHVSQEPETQPQVVTPTVEHVHTWTPVYKTVHHPAGTHEETVYETVHHDAQYKTVHHDAVTHQEPIYESVMVTPPQSEQVWVVDSPAVTEEVYVGDECQGCGQVFPDKSSCSYHIMTEHNGMCGQNSVSEWRTTVPEQGHWETVTYEGTAVYEDQITGYTTVTDSAAYDDQVLVTAAWDEQKATGTRTVTDTEAWDEQVLDHYECSECGAVK